MLEHGLESKLEGLVQGFKMRKFCHHTSIRLLGFLSMLFMDINFFGVCHDGVWVSGA